jgi:hypothetical protein
MPRNYESRMLTDLQICAIHQKSLRRGRSANLFLLLGMKDPA